MKLTKELLQKIIKEEVNSIMEEMPFGTKSKVQDYFEKAINGSNAAATYADDVGVVGKMWDEIIFHVKTSPQVQMQWVKELKSKTAQVPWSKEYNNFVVFYFKKALEEVKSGLLDPSNTISGEQMEQEQRAVRNARKDAWEKKQAEENAKALAMSPNEKDRAEEWAMYGGDPSKRPWGLGT